MPNPESIDPIYADIKAKQAAAATVAETTKKEIEELKKSISTIAPRDPGRRKAFEDLKKKERQLLDAEQMEMYYEIRAEKRKFADMDEYLKAYDAGKPWPDPSAFLAYKKAEELRTAPREWGKHIPHMNRYNSVPEDVQKKKLEDKLKAVGGGGGH